MIFKDSLLVTLHITVIVHCFNLFFLPDEISVAIEAFVNMATFQTLHVVNI